MLRTTAVTLAFIAVTTFDAAAKDYTDEANNFRVAVPDGWTTPAPPNPVIKFRMASPRVAATRGNCNVITQTMETTQGLSQADLEAQMDASIDDAFWINGMKHAKFVTDASIEDSGTKMRNGYKSYFAVANVSATVPEIGAVKAKSQQMIEAIPGQIFIVTCTASDAGYAQEESDFNIVFDSFAPLSSTPVAAAWPNGVSALTLYAKAQFGGVSRVVTQDTPDFAAKGWRDAQASISIAGAQAWELCEGANYSGACRVVNGALPAGVTAPVLSARRYVPQRGDFARLLRSSSDTAIEAGIAR